MRLLGRRFDGSDFLLCVGSIGENAQHLVEGVYEFDGTGWRDCEPCGDVDLGMFALARDVISPSGDEAGCAQSDRERAAVEESRDELISVALSDFGVIDDAEFLFSVGSHEFVFRV
jgi:hypothetical protein